MLVLNKKGRRAPLPCPWDSQGLGANAHEPRAVSVVGLGQWGGARGGQLIGCSSRLPWPNPARDMVYLPGEGAIPPGFWAGTLAGDTL